MKVLLFLLAVASAAPASADALVCRVNGWWVTLDTPPSPRNDSPDISREYSIQNPQECAGIASGVASSMAGNCPEAGRYVLVNYAAVNPAGNTILGGSLRLACSR